jgi:hypothetical protein
LAGLFLFSRAPVGELALEGFHRPVATFNVLRFRESG